MQKNTHKKKTKCKETKHYIFPPKTKIHVCLVKCFSRCVCFFIQFFVLVVVVVLCVHKNFIPLRATESCFSGMCVLVVCGCCQQPITALWNKIWTTRNEMPVLNFKELSSRSTDNMGPRKLSSQQKNKINPCAYVNIRDVFFIVCVFRENKNPSRWSNQNKRPQLRLGCTGMGSHSRKSHWIFGVASVAGTIGSLHIHPVCLSASSMLAETNWVVGWLMVAQITVIGRLGL